MASTAPRSTSRKPKDPETGELRRGPRRRAKGACGPGGVQRSKAGPWRAGVLVLVHVLIALHVAHFVATGRTVSPLEPSEAMRFTKDGIVNAGLVFFGAAILATALFGRWFCGWGCHIVALQDGSRWLLGKLGIRPRPLRSRLLLFVPALAFGYMFLYPLAYRLWHGLGLGYRGSDLGTNDFWATFPPWPIALATFLFSGFLVVYFLGAKGFCTYACPYGAIFGAVDRLAPGRIRVTDACEGCGHCTAVCSSNVQVHAEVRDYGAVVDPGCMKCMDCVSVCPKDALYFGFGRPELLTRARDASATPRRPRSKLASWKQLAWWEELVLGLAFAAGFLCFRGLYGMVPFLFSLAIAGVLAYLCLQLARLCVRRNVSVQRFAVKADGRLTRSGYAFLGLMLPVGLFWAHSGWVQLETSAMDGAWPAMEELHRSWFQDPDRRLAPEELARIADLRARGERLARYALVADPRQPRRAAVLELLAGDEAGFERDMAELARARAADPEPSLELAEFLAARGRMDEAFARFAAALELAPTDPEPRRRLVLAAQARGALAGASDVLGRALERRPGDAGLLHDAARVELELGRVESALPLLRRALAADPGRLDAREDLALALKVLGRDAEAIVELEALLAADPSLQDARFQLADSAARLGEYERAERELERLEGESEVRAQAWGLVGNRARERGDAAEAQRFFARAAELGRAGPRRN